MPYEDEGKADAESAESTGFGLLLWAFQRITVLFLLAGCSTESTKGVVHTYRIDIGCHFVLLARGADSKRRDAVQVAAGMNAPASGKIRIALHKRTDHRFTRPNSLQRPNSLVEASCMRAR